MKIRPLRSRVLIKIEKKEEEVRASGLINISITEKPIIRGVVVAKGDGVTSININDLILFPRIESEEVEIAMEKYLLIEEDNVLAVIE